MSWSDDNGFDDAVDPKSIFVLLNCSDPFY